MANRPPRLPYIFQEYSRPLWFITFCTPVRKPILATGAVHDRFRMYIANAEKHNIAVGRYVLMPDHLHFFVAGSHDFELRNWVGMLKRYLSVAIAASPPHWQEGFFDHLVRKSESYGEKWEYVRMNPVRAGLVSSPEDWPFAGEFMRLPFD